MQQKSVTRYLLRALDDAFSCLICRLFLVSQRSLRMAMLSFNLLDDAKLISIVFSTLQEFSWCPSLIHSAPLQYVPFKSSDISYLQHLTEVPQYSVPNLHLSPDAKPSSKELAKTATCNSVLPSVPTIQSCIFPSSLSQVVVVYTQHTSQML